jgi:hypothetical protein
MNRGPDLRFLARAPRNARGAIQEETDLPDSEVKWLIAVDVKQSENVIGYGSTRPTINVVEHHTRVSLKTDIGLADPVA